MTDTTDLMPEILRTIQNEAANTRTELRQGFKLIHERTTVLEMHMSAFEMHMSALVSASAYQEERFATIEQRLHRLEARLNMVNGDTP